jgi:uncharacterized protein (TIGR04255 family)
MSDQRLDHLTSPPASGRYSRAPIIEAVIDLRISVDPSVTLDDLAKVHAQESQRYPQVKKRMEVKGEIGLEEAGVRAAAVGAQTGHVLTSSDEKYIAQVRLDGFSFSRLAPYDSWAPFHDEAMRLWTLYRQIVSPKLVTRLGVRYINRLDIPSQVIEIKDYLRTSPEISPALPQTLASYFMQIQIPLQNYAATVNINSTIVEPPNPNTTSLVLDIDTFRDVNLSSSSDSFDDNLEEGLTELRRAKNFVFEGCITPATREMII